MKWSFKIARLAGIDIRIHATFFILVAWVAWGNWMAAGTIASAVSGVLFVGLLFFCVVLHELGHALTARRFGVPTRDITLLPIGGVARLERMPEEPKQELLVALAGPAVSLALALVLGGLAWLFHLGLDPRDGHGNPLAQLAWINAALAVFNLIPAFPMDGGRALRALLAMRMHGVRATEIAAALGQAVAVLLGLVGLFGNPVLLFIALFVWLGAKAEATTAQLEGALEGIPVGYAAARDVRTVAPDDPIDAAVVHALAGFQHDFPVIDHDGRVVGLLPHHTLLTALDQRGTNVRVASVMERDPAIVHPLELLDRILPRLQQAPGRCLVVVDDRGVLVGLVTVSTVGELVAIRDALHGRRTAALPSGSPSPLRAARA